MLSVSLWSLVLAKARATFQISDLVHREHVKAKYNKIFYIGVMIVVAQLLKLCADQSFVTTLIDEVESKIDGKIAGLESADGK